MPTSQNSDWDNTASRELDVQKIPKQPVATERATSSYGSAPVAESKVPQFRYRVLVVDDAPSIRETAGVFLESKGYEVLAAADGLDGLHALSQSLPDLIICDLNMPRMSGSEFLAIVRKRFPHIATIAMSGGEITGESPSGVLADVLLQKGRFTIKELFQEVAKLLAASPLRAERERSDIAPLFVPRDSAGYLLLTCSKCLRSNKLEALSLDGGVHQTICRSCGAPVKFEINHEIEPLIKRKHR